jgi:hypothetical protein
VSTDLVTKNDEKALNELSGVYRRVLELKYKGYPYKKILEILKEEKYNPPTLNTLQGWFDSVGLLTKHLKTYSILENRLRREEARAIFKRHITDAVKTLVKKLKSRNERVSLDAAREIIDRELGKATENIKTEFSGKIALLQLFKEIESGERRNIKSRPITTISEEDSE